MANESPFIPSSWRDGAPIEGKRSSDGPNYWANPPIAPSDSELNPAPPIAEPPPAAPHPQAWIPTLVEEPVVEEPVVEEPVVEEPVVEAPAAEAPPVDEYPVHEPAAYGPVAEAPAFDPPAAEHAVNQPPLEEHAVEEPVAARPPFTRPVVGHRVVDEPVVPAFARMARAPYSPPPAPETDLTREAEIDRERDANDFREAATPVRGGLFARYTPPVLDPLPTDGSDRKKRRHRLRSRR